MAGEPQGNEFTIALEADITTFAPVGAEFTVAFDADITTFAPVGAEFTIVAPTLPPPGAPPFTDIEALQLTSVTRGKSQVTLDWTAATGVVDNYALYRVPGNMPVASGSDWETVTGEPGVVTVDDNIPNTATQIVEALAEAENGEDWTYYLFAYNMSGYGVSDAVLVEPITGIPHDISLDHGDGTKTISWTEDLGTNAAGVNIYRSKFGWSASEAVKLNVAPQTGSSFVDGTGNANRVSEAAVEYPQNGFLYAYKVESEDTVTTWTDGTSNAVAGGAEDTIASKTEP